MSERSDKTTSARSKSETIIALLQRKTGATITDLSDATTWQNHSVHGFISGTLKKKRGLNVTVIKHGDKPARYKIEGQAQ